MTKQPLPLYTACATAAAATVIGSYSTSFSFATKLLDRRLREDITNLYAVVRIADELVDGAGTAAGLSTQEIGEALDAYEEAVIAAPAVRFHTDPVLHAYAGTARRCGFKEEHMRAFFASMRSDIERGECACTPEELATYIYGSAEVIGLMCLDAFLADTPVDPQQRATMESGARTLGAAFQKINFLRDLKEDSFTLSRCYFQGDFDAAAKDRILADIRTDLANAEEGMQLLPGSSRYGVAAATALFGQLADQLDAMSPEEILQQRAHVALPTKVKVMGRSFLRQLGSR